MGFKFLKFSIGRIFGFHCAYKRHNVIIRSYHALHLRWFFTIQDDSTVDAQNQHTKVEVTITSLYTTGEKL